MIITYNGVSIVRAITFVSLFLAVMVFILYAESVPETKSNIAVMTLKAGNGISEGEAELITDRLRTELFKTGLVNVMEREQMQEILKEQGFQQSGACSDDACMVEMGQLLGVSSMVAGSLGKLGGLFMLNLRIIEIKTGKISAVVSKDVKGDIENVVGEIPPAVKVLITGEERDNRTQSADILQKEKNVSEVKMLRARAETRRIPEDEKKSIQSRNENVNRSSVSFVYETFGEGSIENKYGNTILIKGTNDSVTFMNTSRTTDLPYFGIQLRYSMKIGTKFNIGIGPGIRVGMESYSRKDFFNTELIQRELTITTGEVFLHTGFDYSKKFASTWKFNLGFNMDWEIPVTIYEYQRRGLLDYPLESDSRAEGKLVFGYKLGIEKLLGRDWGLSLDFLQRSLSQQIDFDFDEANSGKLSTTGSYKVIYPRFGLALIVSRYL